MSGHVLPRPTVSLLLLALSLSLGLVRSSRDPNEPPNPLPCDCSDVDPRDDFTRVNVSFTCWEQSGFDGVCAQPFMMQTPEEVPEGYCQISCGRCGCCSTFAQVLQDKAPEFAWLANLSDVGPSISRPGYMAVMLVPGDDAVRRLLQTQGFNNHSQVEKDLWKDQVKDWVNAVVKLHVLPPTWDIAALWTTPFMANGATLTTLSKEYLTANAGKNGGVKVQGPKNTVGISAADIPVCKGYINLLDDALAPAF